MVTNITLIILQYLGMTSLHYASSKGFQPVVELLLDRGSKINQMDDKG